MEKHGLELLVFFGLDPAPPSFRHARPRVRRPSGLAFFGVGDGVQVRCT